MWPAASGPLHLAATHEGPQRPQANDSLSLLLAPGGKPEVATHMYTSVYNGFRGLWHTSDAGCLVRMDTVLYCGNTALVVAWDGESAGIRRVCHQNATKHRARNRVAA